MKTKCYCVGCKLHPLHDKRNEFSEKGWVTGFDVGNFIWSKKEQGVDVECLIPESPAFDDLDIDPKNHEFPVTAYGDGNTVTGYESDDYSYVIRAYCASEDHED